MYINIYVYKPVDIEPLCCTHGNGLRVVQTTCLLAFPSSESLAFMHISLAVLMP